MNAAPPDGVELDAESLAIFSNKGRWSPRFADVKQPKSLNGNSIKVRRVVQLTMDLARKPADALRVLDLGCGDGVFAIEAAAHGCQVLAVDGRTDRMQHGIACAERAGLANVRFVQHDVRKLTRAEHGSFDVIYNLGILYHLDVPDLFMWLEHLAEMCDHAMIIDTHIAVWPVHEARHGSRVYHGLRSEEHGVADSAQQKLGRTYLSIDNPFNFLFTRESIVRLLNDVGFTSVAEVAVPFEPYKHADRVTLMALKGTRVKLSTYPAINPMSETEIAEILRPEKPTGKRPAEPRSVIKRVAKKVLRTAGLEVHRAAKA